MRTRFVIKEEIDDWKIMSYKQLDKKPKISTEALIMRKTLIKTSLSGIDTTDDIRLMDW